MTLLCNELLYTPVYLCVHVNETCRIFETQKMVVQQKTALETLRHLKPTEYNCVLCLRLHHCLNQVWVLRERECAYVCECERQTVRGKHLPLVATSIHVRALVQDPGPHIL